jgi:hypothetical protein
MPQLDSPVLAFSVLFVATNFDGQAVVSVPQEVYYEYE